MGQQDLNAFIANVKVLGFATNNHYRMFIPNFVPGGQADLLLRCTSTTYPGYTLTTNPITIHGEPYNTVAGITYPDFSMTFLLDNASIILSSFYVWMNQVYNKVTREMGFYQNYVRDIAVERIDRNDNMISSILLHDCYPVSIDSIALSAADQDITTVTVGFSYKWAEEWELKEALAKSTNRLSNMLTNITPGNFSLSRLVGNVPSEFMNIPMFNIGTEIISSVSQAGTQLLNSIGSQIVGSKSSTVNAFELNLQRIMRDSGLYAGGLQSYIDNPNAQNLSSMSNPLSAMANNMTGLGNLLAPTQVPNYFTDIAAAFNGNSASYGNTENAKAALRETANIFASTGDSFSMARNGLQSLLGVDVSGEIKNLSNSLYDVTSLVTKAIGGIF